MVIMSVYKSAKYTKIRIRYNILISKNYYIQHALGPRGQDIAVFTVLHSHSYGDTSN
jgi:hypothetical protein